MKNYGFLFWAYAVIWIGIAGYVAFLGVRLRKVSDRLDRLEGSAREDDAR